MNRKDNKCFDNLTRREIIKLATAGTAFLGMAGACERGTRDKKEIKSMEESEIKEEVWQTIQALNRAWTVEGNPDELENYFHKNMVAISPADRERLEGRDNCIASWKAFVEAATIHYWKVTDPEVQLYGDNKFAVATYYYDMSFDMGGKTVKTGGRDMVVLVNEDGKWWVVADQFSPYPRR